MLRLGADLVIADVSLHNPHARGMGSEYGVKMQKIDVSQPDFDSWKGTRFSAGDKRQAVVELHSRIGGSDLLAFDTAPRNVYFKRDAGGRIQAGIWDSDFIDRAGAKLDIASDAYRTGALIGSATTEAKMQLFYEIDYTKPAQAMDLIRQIQYGF